MKSRKVYIQTIGCQMNVYDSGKMMESLVPVNCSPTDSLGEADIIIVNTCAIRQKAVQKVHSFIGRLNSLKTKKENLRIIVAGCVAQQEGRALMNRFPHIDVVLGTHTVHRLPDMLEEVDHNGEPVIDIGMSESPVEFDAPKSQIQAQSDTNRFVTIMRGCDNYCTYCVVPYVRGRETSRRPGDILNEIQILTQSGIKEITLLGQNVNSYGIKEGWLTFPELLEMANRVVGLKRIRFVTSHPKDLSDDLIASFQRLDKLCNHIHLPVQSGSNRILEMMNRKYTRERYIEKVEKLRESAPDISITTDIIVGFPGERHEDFDMTLRLMETVRFDNLFVFEYSDSAITPSSRFPDKILQKSKNERLQEVLRLQKHISTEKDRLLVGQVFPILVEGPSKKELKSGALVNSSQKELTGRSSGNRIVNFSLKTDCMLDIDAMKGEIIDIRIDRVFSNSLQGSPVEKDFLKR
jgi:tRNA-2-methylthio-N6-dimethylallyladenosine synthase